ncbi:zinc-dependent metalloprotease [Alloscardovia theropitheci]|uniref:Zinc-dependent metalloprotease n=1 Tax=Alloscardovia theropitheci TaxID=2496842 RepID=A0A4R0QQX6_9BIFI|nr:zinc-dependent metalloprotease [Alloscardovia theropitheci]TCD54724.1 zinc-dependent metalloprotease [Alloscardovia theropitheci]
MDTMNDGMSEEELHKWMVESFGPFEGEMAWQQFQELPEQMREQLLSQGMKGLPNPHEVQSLMQAFTESGMNSLNDIQSTLSSGPINRRLAKSIAQQRAREGEDITVITASQAQEVRSAASETNLWLDSVTNLVPASEPISVYTRVEWVDATLPAWIDFATPVAASMNEAMSTVFMERFGDAQIDGEVAGLFAGPVNIPLPDDLKNPGKLMQVLGNTSYAMQFGSAAGSLSHDVRGTYDQIIDLTGNPSGGIVLENVKDYAKKLEIDESEVLRYLTLVESAHARLFHNVPWLMPQFKALISKYARSISIDLDAMEQELREAQAMNPESIAGAVNLSKVGMSDTPEQREALQRLETLLALVEGWVDCVVWRAGIPYLPHMEQLREMQRRERITGGTAVRSFEALVGLNLHPRKLREASEMWETITLAEGVDGRDARWQHPDSLPVLADDVMRDLRNASQSKNDSLLNDESFDELNAQLFGDIDDVQDDPQHRSSQENPVSSVQKDSSHQDADNQSTSHEDLNQQSEAQPSQPAKLVTGQPAADQAAAHHSTESQSSAFSSSIDWDSELAHLMETENEKKSAEDADGSSDSDGASGSEDVSGSKDATNYDGPTNSGSTPGSDNETPEN